MIPPCPLTASEIGSEKPPLWSDRASSRKGAEKFTLALACRDGDCAIDLADLDVPKRRLFGADSSFAEAWICEPFRVNNGRKLGNRRDNSSKTHSSLSPRLVRTCTSRRAVSVAARASLRVDCRRHGTGCSQGAGFCCQEQSVRPGSRNRGWRNRDRR